MKWIEEMIEEQKEKGEEGNLWRKLGEKDKEKEEEGTIVNLDAVLINRLTA